MKKSEVQYSMGMVLDKYDFDDENTNKILGKNQGKI